jgi:hypothetical protein
LKPQKIYPLPTTCLQTDLVQREAHNQLPSLNPSLTGWQRDVGPNLPQQRDLSQGLGRMVHGRRRRRETDTEGDGDV